MVWKHTTYNSDPGDMRLKQQLDKTLKITFASLSRKSDEKENKKKNKMVIAKLFAFHENAKNNNEGNKKLFAKQRDYCVSLFRKT